MLFESHTRFDFRGQTVGETEEDNTAMQYLLDTCHSKLVLGGSDNVFNDDMRFVAQNWRGLGCFVAKSRELKLMAESVNFSISRAIIQKIDNRRFVA